MDPFAYQSAYGYFFEWVIRYIYKSSFDKIKNNPSHQCSWGDWSFSPDKSSPEHIIRHMEMIGTHPSLPGGPDKAHHFSMAKRKGLGEPNLRIVIVWY